MARRERIIRVFYDDEDVMFENSEKLVAFQQAVGRMATFALSGGLAPDSVQFVTMNIDKRKEITCAYFDWKQRSFGEESTYAKNKPFYNLDDALALFVSEHCFVMGGIPRNEQTEYSFHS
jgi:hypothetical protein